MTRNPITALALAILCAGYVPAAWAQAHQQADTRPIASGSHVAVSAPGTMMGDTSPGTDLLLMKVTDTGAPVTGDAAAVAGDRVKLKMVTGDRWLVARSGGGARFGTLAEGTIFRVTTLPPAAQPPTPAVQVEPFTASTAFVALGTMDGAPCGRVESAVERGSATEPALRFVPQRLTAFADVRIGNPVNMYFEQERACVTQALARTGLKAIFASPDDALAPFTAALNACMATAAPGIPVQYTLLRVEAACRW